VAHGRFVILTEEHIPYSLVEALRKVRTTASIAADSG